MKDQNAPNIIAFSGAHGTGKTTSVYDFAAKAKKTHAGNVDILLEVARGCPYPILDQTGAIPPEISQTWMFSKQINQETEKAHGCDWLICDRTIVDYIGYTIYSGHISLADAMMSMARQLMHRYAIIIFKSIAKNNYCRPDGLRSTDLTVRQAIEDILLNLYDELGVTLCMDNNPDQTTVHRVHVVNPVHTVHP